MMRYRKRPFVIDAIKFTTPEELTLWAREHGVTSWLDITADEVRITTLEGVMSAKPGDYITRGIKGEVYGCEASRPSNSAVCHRFLRPAIGARPWRTDYFSGYGAERQLSGDQTNNKAAIQGTETACVSGYFTGGATKAPRLL